MSWGIIYNLPGPPQLTVDQLKIPASASADGLMSADDFRKINPPLIAANTDLDSVTDFGWYRCASATTASTLIHCPAGKPFFLQVLDVQTLFPPTEISTVPDGDTPPQIVSQDKYATAAGDIITLTLDYGTAKSLSKMTFTKADGVSTSNILVNTVNLKVSGDQVTLKVTTLAFNGSNWRLVFLDAAGNAVNVPFVLKLSLEKYQHITDGLCHWHRAFSGGAWTNWQKWELTDTTYTPATQSKDGLMSADDKTKLDSTNVYTTAEQTKLAGIESGAQVNEVSLAQYRDILGTNNALATENKILRTQLSNLLNGLNIPVYMTAAGTGAIDFLDAAAAPILSLTVDSSLAGQTVYVQLSNASGLTDTTATVDSNGAAAVSLATTKGRNRLYITTSAYTFPPFSGGHGPSSGGTYVNAHTDENGSWSYDAWVPSNAVAATVRYMRDAQLGAAEDRIISYDDFLSMLNLGVNYVQTTDPAATAAAGKDLYAKLDGYPHGTKDAPVYAKTSYPNAYVRVFYVAEYYWLDQV